MQHMLPFSLALIALTARAAGGLALRHKRL